VALSGLLARLCHAFLVSKCFEFDAILDDVDRNIFKRCFLQPTVSISYSFRSKAVHMGFVPGIIIYSFLHATTTLDVILLLYAVLLI